MTLQELIRSKVLGVEKFAQIEKPDEDRLAFINSEEALAQARIKEYNVWYEGDGDELLNFYTYGNMISFCYEPFYARNKKNYFWSISSTEEDIKRSHSGQPRNIVDTLSSIIKFPLISGGVLPTNEDIIDKHLKEIIKESNLKEIFKQEQIPLTLVEGWGCYKINWDLDESDYPYVVYYKAENVDFIYKANRIKGIIFRDYYTNGERRYVLVETRSLQMKEVEDGGREKTLVIEKQLFERLSSDGSTEYLKEVAFSEVPQLEDVVDYVEIGPFDKLFAAPCVFFKNTSGKAGYGRSIFTGKIDLFDDLDQCLSQAANTVRKSTPLEYFNSEYLERDADGLPVQPKAYDRKYSIYNGATDANGIIQGDPVKVTQPTLNLQQYTQQATDILIQIINGIMSPATLGIDIAKKDNAEAQREKEKVTIFTRNTIIDSETEILKSLCNQLLCAYEFMHNQTITCKDYDISIKFSEFADDSYESKLKELGAAYDSLTISTEMFLDKLYDGTLNKADYERELKFLRENHDEPRRQGMTGVAGGGDNMEGLINNMEGLGDDE